MPQTWTCSHCHEQCSRCQNLAYHIEHQACQQFQPERPDLSTAPIDRPELRDQVQQEGAESLCGRAELCKELAGTCAVCGQYVANASKISQHLQKKYKHLTLRDWDGSTCNDDSGDIISPQHVLTVVMPSMTCVFTNVLCYANLPASRRVQRKQCGPKT